MTDDVSAFHSAVHDWHEKLQQEPSTSVLAAHGVSQGLNGAADASGGPSERVALASELLASCLEDHGLPDSFVDDVMSVLDTFKALCGLNGAHDTSGSSRSTTASLNPAKLKLLKAATGLPVHTTSIGRRASASYCVYDSMGGWETLSAAVESLYNRMRNDSRCASLFTDADEQQLKTHMLEFLSCALGGKARFASSTLLTSQRDQLRSHGFGVGQFDLLMQHMKAVLDELSVQPEIAASAIALLRCHKYLFEKRVSEEDGSADLPPMAEEAATAHT